MCHVSGVHSTTGARRQPGDARRVACSGRPRDVGGDPVRSLRTRPVPPHTEAAPSAARARDSVSEFAAYPVGFTKQYLRVDAMRNT